MLVILSSIKNSAVPECPKKLPCGHGMNEGPLIAFALRRDIGGRWKLDLHRVPVDYVEKRVRISGIVVADGLVDVEALGPDVPTV